MQARSPRLPPTDSAKAGRGEQNPTAKNQSRAFNLNHDIVRRTGAGRRPGAASHRKGCIRRVASVNRRKRHGKRTLNAALGTRTGHDAHKATYTSRNVPPWTYRSHSAPPRTHKSHSAPPWTYKSHSAPPWTRPSRLMARFTRLSRLTAGFTRPGRPSVGFTRGPAMGPLPAGAQKGPAFVDRAFRARVPGAAYLIHAGPLYVLTIFQ